MCLCQCRSLKAKVTLAYTKLLLNSEVGWAARLSLVIGGSTGVHIGVLGADLVENQGATAIFLILYLHRGGFFNGLPPTEPYHLWIRVPYNDRCQEWLYSQPPPPKSQYVNPPKHSGFDWLKIIQLFKSQPTSNKPKFLKRKTYSYC